MHESDAVLSGGVRRCLPVYYSVLMADGTWKKISEIVAGDIIRFNGKQYPITNVFSNGVQDLIKINTSNGFHVSTPNHRWLVYNKETKNIEWVEAQYLTSKHSFLASKKDKYLSEESVNNTPRNTINDKHNNSR
jgi:hypothetical protein